MYDDACQFQLRKRISWRYPQKLKYIKTVHHNGIKLFTTALSQIAEASWFRSSCLRKRQCEQAFCRSRQGSSSTCCPSAVVRSSSSVASGVLVQDSCRPQAKTLSSQGWLFLGFLAHYFWRIVKRKDVTVGSLKAFEVRSRCAFAGFNFLAFNFATSNRRLTHCVRHLSSSKA